MSASGVNLEFGSPKTASMNEVISAFVVGHNTTDDSIFAFKLGRTIREYPLQMNCKGTGVAYLSEVGMLQHS